jgi:hypothetical protein
LSYLFGSHKFHKIENNFIFGMLKKKMWANFQRNIELFTQKYVTKLSKDGSGIRDPRKNSSGSRIRVPGVKKAPDPGPESATLNKWEKNAKRGVSSKL